MWASLKAAAHSRRIGAVTLQSFSSGLPLGLVWIALPAFLTYRGFDIKTVGLFSLAQAPWSFKFLWSPLMDRYGPRFGSVGRRRAWILICQVLLTAGILGLAAVGGAADVGTVALLALFIAFASACQMALGALASLRCTSARAGIAVGARTALARTAVLLSGAVTITFGQRLGWPPVFRRAGPAFVPMAVVVLPRPTSRRRRPAVVAPGVFDPLLELFRRSDAYRSWGSSFSTSSARTSPPR